MLMRSLLPSFTKRTRTSRDDDNIYAIWMNYQNWGDALNPLLIQQISGKKPVLVTRGTIVPENRPVYAVIGSILDNIVNQCSNIHLIIWGTGFISQKGHLNIPPSQICAVRGPLTRKILIKQGLDCPEIYGDPAILYPKFYKPKLFKKYKLGIIPHYVDKNNPILNEIHNYPDILIIDIQDGIKNVVDKICSCQKIASSSLHGIIAADAYGIPSTWIQLSNTVIGDGFKFFDYFHSVGRNHEKPFILDNIHMVDDIYSQFYKYNLELDIGELWEACPFR